MALYRELDPSLPDLGWARMFPLPLTARAARDIHACADAAALGAMAGAARSYWGPAGAIPTGAALGAAFLALGWNLAAAIAFLAVVPAGHGTIETRRRARQWESVIAARLSALAAHGS